MVVQRGPTVGGKQQLAADRWFFPPGARVSAVARTPDNLDLFITGNDGRVYTSWWFNGADWSGVNDNWRPIGGFFPPGAPVTAVARKSGQLDLFVTGNDGRVYTLVVDGADWSGVDDNWRPIGGFFPPGCPGVGRGPDAGQPGPVHHRERRSRLHVVVVQEPTGRA